MIKKTLLFLILLFVIQTAYSKQVNFYAKVDNPIEKQLTFTYLRADTDENLSVYKLDLKAGNEVEFLLDIEKDKFIDLTYNGIVIKIYVRSNDDLKLFFDGQNIRESLRFEGVGAENNNLIADYYRSYKSDKFTEFEAAHLTIKIEESLAKQAKEQPIDNYLSSITQLREDQMKFLMFRKLSSEIDPFVFDYLKYDILYSTEVQKIYGFIQNKEIVDVNDYQTLSEKHQLLKSIKIRDDQRLNHAAYLNFMNALILYKYLPRDMNKSDLLERLYELADRELDGRSRYYILAQLMLDSYNKTGKTTLAQKYFQQYEQANPYEEYTQTIRDAYGTDLQLMPRAVAPNFTVKDKNGKNVSLSNYKGKVVYISFWASWCKPCIQGFKKSKEIRTQLDNMGVVLLNISLDKKESNWRNAMQQYAVLGENTIATDLDGIKRLYDISSIPAYHIVGKDGRFTYLSDKIDRDIVAEFKSMLDN